MIGDALYIVRVAGEDSVRRNGSVKACPEVGVRDGNIGVRLS